MTYSCRLLHTTAHEQALGQRVRGGRGEEEGGVERGRGGGGWKKEVRKGRVRHRSLHLCALLRHASHLRAVELGAGSSNKRSLMRGCDQNKTKIRLY